MEPTTTRHRVRAGLAAFAVVLGFVLSQIVAGGIVIVIAHAFGVKVDLTDIDTASAIALICVQLLQFAIGLAVATRISDRRSVGLDSTRAERRAGMRALTPVAALIVLLPLVLALGGGDSLIDPALGASEIAALSILAFIIALNEELWFRGLVVSQLGGRSWPMGAILISAVFFGLPHVGGDSSSWLNAAGVTLAVGIPFAAVRIVTRSLFALVLVHGLIDLWAFLHTGAIQTSGSPTLGEVIGSLLFPSALALGYVAWTRRRIHSDAGSDAGA